MHFLFVIGLAAAAMLSGCERTPENGEDAVAPTTAGSRNIAAVPEVLQVPEVGDGRTLLEKNDRAITENKRLIAMLARFQSADFARYERLRQVCEARGLGTLTDAGAVAVAHCIAAGWRDAGRRDDGA